MAQEWFVDMEDDEEDEGDEESEDEDDEDIAENKGSDRDARPIAETLLEEFVQSAAGTRAATARARGPVIARHHPDASGMQEVDSIVTQKRTCCNDKHTARFTKQQVLALRSSFWGPVRSFAVCSRSRGNTIYFAHAAAAGQAQHQTGARCHATALSLRAR